MSFGRTDDFPESTLADDDHSLRPRPSTTYRTNFQPFRTPMQRLAMRGRGGSQGGRTPHPNHRSQMNNAGGNYAKLTPLHPRNKTSAINLQAATPPTHPIDLTTDDDDASAEHEATLEKPSQKIITREQQIQQKQVRDLTIEDFTIEDSSDGTSLLVARIVDAIYTFHSDLTHFQLARLAAHAITHHPLRLLDYLKNTSSMNSFVVTALCTFPVDTTDHSNLCPIILPHLLADDTLRLKMDGDELTDEDRKDIIYYFGSAFYPSHIIELMSFIQNMPSTSLPALITEKGALIKEIERLYPDAQFSPPEWTDLSVIPPHQPTPPSAPPPRQTIQHFDPMEHMGMPRTEFTKLPLDLMKQIALVKLPHALAPITTTPTILTILTALREAKSSQTMEFLLAETFAHHLHPLNNAENATHYYYRLRLQMMRGKRSPLWKNSPGTILSHWLQAAIPIIVPRHTLTLIHPPHNTDQDQLSLTSIPTAHTVSRYVNDIHTDRSTQITHMDFWILTSCPDIFSILSRLHGAAHNKYHSDLDSATMRVSTQEQFPTDTEICGVLIGSSSRDDNTRILLEIVERLDQQDVPSPQHITVTWMSIRNTMDEYSTMAKCILSPGSRAQQTRTLIAQLQPPSTNHLVTRNFQLAVIPPPTDQTYENILSRTITSQFSTLESTTMISFSNLEKCDPFTLVPTITLMANDPLSINNETMASLILHGQLISKEGSTLTSPVTRIAADSKGNRIHLFAPKTSARPLITFAEHLLVLLPTWTNQTGKAIQIEMKDIQRTLRESHQIHTPNTTSQLNTQDSQPKHPQFPQPPMAPATQNRYPPYPPPLPLAVPILADTHYARINDQLSILAHRMDHTDNTLAEILATIRNSQIPSHTEWTNTIISAITPAILSESDSIRAHQLITSSTQHTQLMIPLDRHSQDISDQKILLQTHIDNSNVTQATLKRNTEHTNTLLTNMISEAHLIRHNVTKLIDTVTSTSTHTTPSTASLDIPPNDKVLLPAIGHLTEPLEPKTNNAYQINTRDPLDTPPPHIDYEVDVDIPFPSKGDCTACHEYSEDLKICGDCQLPFDYQCILSIKHTVTNDSDYQCINCHRKQHPQTTQSDGLSESSENSDESSTVRGSSHDSPVSLTAPSDPTGDDPSHKESNQGDGPSDSKSTASHDTRVSLALQDLPKPLRPNSAASARITSTRKSPQKTRNYLKASEPQMDTTHE